ncbi:uncharacterized protein [Dysidea avara]|uniref:uncharacterized protein isoform X2 n=1 Tax=Dysidea avara TaxID=196820 RepID=UPI00332BEED4
MLVSRHRHFEGCFAVADPAKGPKMRYEEAEDRFKSFIYHPSWEGPWEPDFMSEAGFVYTGQEDLVYCFSCNIKLDGWTKHMDPLLRHKKESPTCSFVRQQLQIIKGEKGKVKSVVAPSKPLNPRQTASIGQLQSSTVFSSKPIHTVVTGLDELRSCYTARKDDDYLLTNSPITVQNYGSETERLTSFIGWPLNESVHSEQLARVGFVYTGEGSLVQCFQCGVRYRNWLKGDIPLSVHQRCNPDCSFLQTLTSKSKYSAEKQKLATSYIQQPPQCETRIEFPDYSDQATRLQSFKYWGGVLPKEELAEAGFYMIARRDVIKCFSCYLVLQDWEIIDSVTDEHQRRSPNCQFLKLYLSLSSIGGSCQPSKDIVVTEDHAAEKSVEMKSRDYITSQLTTSLASIDFRLPPPLSTTCYDTTALPRSDDNEHLSGINYQTGWTANPPQLSPPGGVYVFEENASSHKLPYNILTFLQPVNAFSESKQILCKEPLSGGTENQVIESPNSRDDTDEHQRYNYNYSSLNQQPSSVGMSADFSSTGSNHGTEYHPRIITSPSSMGSSLQYPLQYTTGSSDTLVTFKEKTTVVQSGLISQYKEPLSGGTENHVVESPNYIDEHQRSSSKYSSLNQHLLNSGVNTNFPSPGNSFGIEYHGQSYVTGTSSLGSPQQHLHQPVILPAVPLPTGSSIAQGLNYGGYYGAQEELAIEEQPPQDDPTFQYEEPLSRGAENRVVESPNYGDDCVDECQWFNPNLLIQQPSSIGMNTNISSTGNSNDVEYQPAGGIVNAPSSLGPSQHYPCHSSTMPAATNSWEPPVPLGGQVYQGSNYRRDHFTAQSSLLTSKKNAPRTAPAKILDRPLSPPLTPRPIQRSAMSSILMVVPPYALGPQDDYDRAPNSAIVSKSYGEFMEEEKMK